MQRFENQLFTKIPYSSLLIVQIALGIIVFQQKITINFDQNSLTI